MTALILEDRLSQVTTLAHGAHDPDDGAMCAMDIPALPFGHAGFWRYVDHGEGCWTWTGGRSGGYGTFRHEGRTQKAHRVAWQLERGDIPEGLVVCHQCDNPGCVRPDHLFLGTVAENNADRANKGRSKGTFRSDSTHPGRVRAGELHWGAKLTARQVDAIRQRRERGEPVKALAAEFGVHHATISRIARRVWRKEVA